MGQYWKVVNVDKKEFLNPHRLGCGLKLREQLHTTPGTAQALFMLCTAWGGSRGGGDFDTEKNSVIGRWAGDRIVIVGDYSEDSDLPTCQIPLSKCYPSNNSELVDISDSVAEMLEREFEGKYTDCDGWARFEQTAPRGQGD